MSNLAQLYSEYIEKKVISPVVTSYDDFTTWLDGFMNPHFSTTDFEKAHTKCLDSYEIKNLNYMSGSMGFPNLAVGAVIPAGNEDKVKVYWDYQGHCRMLTTNLRQPEWDLIRADQKEIDSAKTITGALMLGVVVILVCTIL